MSTTPPLHSQRLALHPDVLGTTIRRFREQARVSTRELARRMGVAASYVSKVELGQLGCRPEFCRRLGSALKLPEAERRLLGALVALQATEHRRVPFGDPLERTQRLVRKFEESCHSIKVLQLSLVPGLLQTRDYVHAIFSRLADRARRSVAVAERLTRQAILKDRGRTFQFLIADWALAPHWCSAGVMHRQLKQLRTLVARPNVDIRILPHDFRFPEDVPPLVSGFEVLDDALVIVDTLSGFTTYRQPEDVAMYLSVFDKVFPQAVQVASGRDRAVRPLQLQARKGVWRPTESTGRHESPASA